MKLKTSLLKKKKMKITPIYNFNYATTFAYTQTLETKSMQFNIVCHDIPEGSMISISSKTTSSDNTKDPSPPIKLDPTQVSTSPNFTAGIVSTIPQGYSGLITFEVSTDDELPNESYITCSVSYVESSGSGPSKMVVVKKVATTFSQLLGDDTSESTWVYNKPDVVNLAEVSYSFTLSGTTVTVHTNTKIQKAIQGDANIEKTILDIVLGTITTHTFGKTCSGNWGNSTNYVHVTGTKSRDLLGYDSPSYDASNHTGSVNIDATGYAKDGNHIFNVKGNF